MYNGIGLRTARGTGTNGYVQKNLSFIKPKHLQQNRSDYKYDEHATTVPAKKPAEEVLKHNSRRQVENEILEYREELEAKKSYTEEEIEELVQSQRKKLLADLESRILSGKDDVLLEAKEKEMIKMKDAFGIKGGKDGEAVEGRAFNFDNEKQRQQKREKKAKEDEDEKQNRRYRPY